MSEFAGLRAAATALVCALAVAAGPGAPARSARSAPDAPSVGPGPQAAGGMGPVIPGTYLVSLRVGEPAAVAAEHARLGVRVGHVLTAAWRGYTARMTPAQASAVAADPRVRAVLRDRAYRNASIEVDALADPDPPLLKQAVPPGVARVGGPGSSAKSGDGSGVVDADIAVLDTGIDTDHPDLDVAGGIDCVTDGLFEGDTFDDERGHGTHIAGTAAARDNGMGVVGVAPGARVWAVRVLDATGGGSLSTLICGIDWVAKNADVIEVANMSLTGLDADSGCADGALHEAICAAVSAGVTFTVAAGNNAADAIAFTPATYPEVITVSALADFDGRPGGLAAAACPGGKDDEFAEFSNYGPPIDVIAPGLCVRSTWAGGRYATLTGTSQSAGLVAGAAALYLSTHPKAKPAQVRDALADAGSADWETTTDPDGVPDPLLDVSKL